MRVFLALFLQTFSYSIESLSLPYKISGPEPNSSTYC